MQLASMQASISPIIGEKDWVQLQQLMLTITPITPVGDWQMLQTMQVSIAPTGAPVPTPPPIPPEEEGKTMIWVALALVGVVIVAGILAGKGR